MTRMAKESLLKNITHKLKGLKEYTLNEVAFFVDYIQEREKSEILLSTKELEKLKKTKLKMRQRQPHTLEEL